MFIIEQKKLPETKIAMQWILACVHVLLILVVIMSMWLLWINSEEKNNTNLMKYNDICLSQGQRGWL